MQVMHNRLAHRLKRWAGASLPLAAPTLRSRGRLICSARGRWALGGFAQTLGRPHYSHQTPPRARRAELPAAFFCRFLDRLGLL